MSNPVDERFKQLCAEECARIGEMIRTVTAYAADHMPTDEAWYKHTSLDAEETILQLENVAARLKDLGAWGWEAVDTVIALRGHRVRDQLFQKAKGEKGDKAHTVDFLPEPPSYATGGKYHG